MDKELAANATLSHYRIVSKIGAGGMGEVFLAEDSRWHLKAALKFLPESLAADKERLRRFEREHTGNQYALASDRQGFLSTRRLQRRISD